MFKRLCSSGFLRGPIQSKKGSLREIYQKSLYAVFRILFHFSFNSYNIEDYFS